MQAYSILSFQARCFAAAMGVPFSNDLITTAAAFYASCSFAEHPEVDKGPLSLVRPDAIQGYRKFVATGDLEALTGLKLKKRASYPQAASQEELFKALLCKEDIDPEERAWIDAVEPREVTVEELAELHHKMAGPVLAQPQEQQRKQQQGQQRRR